MNAAINRVFDIVVSVVVLLLCMPLLACIAIAIVFTTGSPVLYCQKRTGWHGCIFAMAKFRTMLDTVDKEGRPLPDSQRLTRLGRFLRSTSLDELPELYNVLRGDMSLVGPRPLLPQYLDRYTAEQTRRHEVKPGITGWAQINGRNAISWEEKFQLDVWYVDHQSFWLNLKILVLTVWKILVRDGVSADGHATMPEFKGSTAEDVE